MEEPKPPAPLPEVPLAGRHSQPRPQHRPHRTRDEGTTGRGEGRGKTGPGWGSSSSRPKRGRKRQVKPGRKG